MYLLPAFKIQDDSKSLQIMSRWNFVDLITTHKGEITSNKLPLLLNCETKTLYGHMGKINPQLQHLYSCDDLLVVFSGPHTYVSPSWYDSPQMVPTWNFQTVQVHGKAERIETEELIETLSQLTDFHESDKDKPWTMAGLSPENRDRMLAVIEGFKIQITQISHKEKMSQNRSPKDRQSIIRHLQQQDNENAQAVAKIMAEFVD